MVAPKEMAPQRLPSPGARPTERMQTVDTRSLAHPTRTVPAETRPLRLRPCSGCSESVPRRELIELHEDNHDNLSYFPGELLCRECANAAGVIL